jgi:hypothetical protein
METTPWFPDDDKCPPGANRLTQAPQADPPAASSPDEQGPLLRWAVALCAHLREAESLLDLDVLDRLARRHARVPASGSAEALEALATLAQIAPDLFRGAEVNLQPERLGALADRERALALLLPLVKKLWELVADSHLEQGDEVVELLTVGWQRAQRLADPAALAQVAVQRALAVLAGYHARVAAEGAHRSEEDRKNEDKTRKQKRQGP